MQKISEENQCYDPLAYPLLFPSGTTGWQPGMCQVNSTKEISPKMYYAYRFQERANTFNTVSFLKV